MGGVVSDGSLLMQIRCALEGLAVAGHRRTASFGMPEAAAFAALREKERARVYSEGTKAVACAGQALQPRPVRKQLE